MYYVFAMAFTGTLIPLLVTSNSTLDQYTFALFEAFMQTFWERVGLLLGTLGLIRTGSSMPITQMGVALIMATGMSDQIHDLLTMTSAALRLVPHTPIKYLDPVYQAHQLRKLDVGGAVYAWTRELRKLDLGRAAYRQGVGFLRRGRGTGGGDDEEATGDVGEEGHVEASKRGGERGEGAGVGLGEEGHAEASERGGERGERAGAGAGFGAALVAVRALRPRLTAAPRGTRAPGTSGGAPAPAPAPATRRPSGPRPGRPTGKGSNKSLLRERKDALLALCLQWTGSPCP